MRAQVINQDIYCGRKFCTACMKPRPLIDFYVHSRKGHERVRLQSYCAPCGRGKQRVREGIKKRGRPYEMRQPSKLGLKTGPTGYIIETERDREIYRQYQRERYARMTPEQRENRREYYRIYEETKRREQGIEPRNFKGRTSARFKRDEDMLPKEPFQHWIESRIRYHGGLEEATRALGIDPRRIYEVRFGDSEYVSMNTVDTALINDGSAFLFELYPELGH